MKTGCRRLSIHLAPPAPHLAKEDGRRSHCSQCQADTGAVLQLALKGGSILSKAKADGGGTFSENEDNLTSEMVFFPRRHEEQWVCQSFGQVHLT